MACNLGKRTCELMMEVGNASVSKKHKGHWSQGLLASITDPNLIVEEDDLTVTIKDKYPKAEYHFLVMPKDSITSTSNLSSSHIPLLKHMQQRGEELAARSSSSLTFRCGYHAVPSMSQLHMHVISQDFISPSLKTKKHWNSFTTEYFIDSHVLIKMLQDDGKVQFDTSRYLEILKKDLRCHVCSKSIPTMPALKSHILQHLPSAAKQS